MVKSKLTKKKKRKKEKLGHFVCLLKTLGLNLDGWGGVMLS